MASEKTIPQELTSQDVCSILPSYSMYNSLYKSATVDEDDSSSLGLEPPLYTQREVSGEEILSAQASVFSPIGSRRTSTSDPNQILADDTSVTWQNTIMDNILDLKNLSNTGNVVAKSTKVTVYFTANVGGLGVKPIPLDNSKFEYNRGDFIHGYVLIENMSDEEIPFDMFYLLFEGTARVKGKIKKNFLQMFDFSASSNPGQINRLKTEFLNPYTCAELQDPLDGTYLSFSGEKLQLLPKRVYKRYFTYRIPENLLDVACNHHLNGHVELPPTMTGGSKVNDVDRIRDFSFPGSDITYGVMARFIGRKSAYNVDKEWEKSFQQPSIVNTKGDEYIILQEDTKYLRVIQRSDPFDPVKDRFSAQFHKSMLDNIHHRAEEHIKEGKEKLNMIVNEEFTDLEQQKYRQSYEATRRDRKFSVEDEPELQYYEMSRLLQKKATFTASKPMGMMSVRSPKITHQLKYIPPTSFIQDGAPSWKLQIPIEFHFSSPQTKLGKLPEFKYFQVDLGVVTYQSERAIPLEFHPDFVFNQIHNNKSELAASLTGVKELEMLVEDTAKLSRDLFDVCKKLGPGNFKVERSLVDDLKAICAVESKTNYISIPDVTVGGKQFTHRSLDKMEWTQNGQAYSKSVTVDIDMEKMQLKGYAKSDEKSFNRFTLVPSFHSCFMGRMYFIRVLAGFSTGQYIHLKIPLHISKPWSENFCECP